MSTRLRCEYDTINQAISQVNALRGGLEDALGTGNGFLNDLLGSWLGLASKAFGGWWEGIGRQRAVDINNEMDSMAQKLGQIMQTVQQMDEELSAMFRPQS